MGMFYFFFQAEDGIRDKLVTGVQTCALPISFLLQTEELDGQVVKSDVAAEPAPTEPDATAAAAPARRSRKKKEERDRKSVRVGKECRSRGSPGHRKKEKQPNADR